MNAASELTVDITGLMKCTPDIFGAYKNYTLEDRGTKYVRKSFLGYYFYTGIGEMTVVSIPIIGNVYCRISNIKWLMGITFGK